MAGEITFESALQTSKVFREEGLLTDIRRVECFATLLAAIATHRVGNRPNRVEPRASKRQTDDLLPVLRDVARIRLLQNNELKYVPLVPDTLYARETGRFPAVTAVRNHRKKSKGS